MNNSTAKTLRKLAEHSGLPYKLFKKYYTELNSQQRSAFMEEAKEILEK